MRSYRWNLGECTRTVSEMKRSIVKLHEDDILNLLETGQHELSRRREEIGTFSDVAVEKRNLSTGFSVEVLNIQTQV
ncbi:hypothetical protein Y032_0032g2599 [Ancylostoma ceylanicum]|uniref:Uncharacterized protein n=1 Tax=Ancylostoma ceylanicum TaxID=53326 RepID=A0A016UQ37_9BILA|nr:hypothetical protein Y032_0032g2599 [Ancylostoma ceylanicum]